MRKYLILIFLLFLTGCGRQFQLTDEHINIVEYIVEPVSGDFKDMYTLHFVVSNNNAVSVYGSYNQALYNSFFKTTVDVEFEYIAGAIIDITEEDKMAIVEAIEGLESVKGTGRYAIVFDEHGEELFRLDGVSFEKVLYDCIPADELAGAVENIESMLNIYLRGY